MKTKSFDVDVDPGMFTVADYARKDEESTPGENHPEDETTGAGTYATIVKPNAKCSSCLHYDANRTACMQALYPTSCGDGSKPETGYAPSIADPAINAAKKVVDGMKVSAPVAMIDAGSSNGNDDTSAAGALQMLGDEVFNAAMHRNTRNGKEMLQKAVRALNTVWKSLPEHARQPYSNQTEFIDRIQKGGLVEEFGKEAAGAMYRCRRLIEKALPGMAYARARKEVYHANAAKTKLPTNAGISHEHMAAAAIGNRAAADAHVAKWKAAGSPNVRAKHGAAVAKPTNLQLVHGADEGGDKTKTSVKPASLKEGTVAAKPSNVSGSSKKPGMFSTAKKKLGGLLTRVGTKLAASMDPASDVYAKATAAWQKVSPDKKRTYVKQAMARHHKAGEKVKAAKYEKRAPREFVQRIIGKSQSFVNEFGTEAAGEMLVARREIRDVLVKAKDYQRHTKSGKLVWVRGNGVHGLGGVRRHTGRTPDQAAESPHGTYMIHGKMMKFVPHEESDGVKLPTSQYQSVSHAKEIAQRHADKHSASDEAKKSINEVTLVKSFIVGKTKAIGLTASGKKIHTGESGFTGWTEDDHRDAGDVLEVLANKLRQSKWASETQANPALRKVFNDAADRYAKLRDRHYASARTKAKPLALTTVPDAAPFEKALNLRTDEGLAKAIAENGLLSERNLRADGSVVSSLPDGGTEIEETIEKALPEVGPYPLTIGGNVSTVHDTASPFLLGTK